VFDDHGDAVISWSGSQAARLTIVGALISRPGSHYGVQRIRFGDGKVWTEKDLLARMGSVQPGATSAWLYGSTGSDSFDSKGRAHGIVGRGGGDTITYKRGYGDLDIDEADAGVRPRNSLHFGPGIAPTELHVQRSGDDLTLKLADGIAPSGSKITLRGEFLRSGVVRGLQSIAFASITVVL
jgi:hypothetical protein